MGRAPCCEKVGLKKGRWTDEEDKILINYIKANGHGSWRSLPKNAGLLRCGKSCRLRWINYLRAELKRGNFTEQEEYTIVKLHASIGNRWSIIASHLPGRTDNEIKNYWNSHLSRKIYKFYKTSGSEPISSQPNNNVNVVRNTNKVDVVSKPRRAGRVSRSVAKKYNKNIINKQAALGQLDHVSRAAAAATTTETASSDFQSLYEVVDKENDTSEMGTLQDQIIEELNYILESEVIDWENNVVFSFGEDWNPDVGTIIEKENILVDTNTNNDTVVSWSSSESATTTRGEFENILVDHDIGNICNDTNENMNTNNDIVMSWSSSESATTGEFEPCSMIFGNFNNDDDDGVMWGDWHLETGGMITPLEHDEEDDRLFWLWD